VGVFGVEGCEEDIRHGSDIIHIHRFSSLCSALRRFAALLVLGMGVGADGSDRTRQNRALFWNSGRELISKR
jgi:hypothetical protein